MKHWGMRAASSPDSIASYKCGPELFLDSLLDLWDLALHSLNCCVEDTATEGGEHQLIYNDLGHNRLGTALHSDSVLDRKQFHSRIAVLGRALRACKLWLHRTGSRIKRTPGPKLCVRGMAGHKGWSGLCLVISQIVNHAGPDCFRTRVSSFSNMLPCRNLDLMGILI